MFSFFGAFVVDFSQQLTGAATFDLFVSPQVWLLTECQVCRVVRYAAKNVQ